jgi:hypothetical protein
LNLTSLLLNATAPIPQDVAGIMLVDATIPDGADGMAARPQETATQFKMFAVYQAHQWEYLGGMMRAIISKPQSDGAIDQLVRTGMKTPPDIGVAMLVADMVGVEKANQDSALPWDTVRPVVNAVWEKNGPRHQSTRSGPFVPSTAVKFRISVGRKPFAERCAHRGRRTCPHRNRHMRLPIGPSNAAGRSRHVLP